MVFRLQDFSGGSQGDVDLSSRDCFAHHRFGRAGIILRVHLLICPYNSHALLTVAFRDQRDSRFSRIVENFFSFSLLVLGLEPFQFHFHFSKKSEGILVFTFHFSKKVKAIRISLFFLEKKE